VTKHGQPRVLVADFMAHRRLSLLAALQPTFSVEPPPPGVDLLRYARSSQPDMVVLFAHPWRADKAYRQCRWLKTDLRPTHRVAIINLDAPPREPSLVMEQDRADGYWQGGARTPELVAFLQRVWAGERPVVVKKSAMGLLARLMRR
jgi:CheY-like chemotaxis protein